MYITMFYLSNIYINKIHDSIQLFSIIRIAIPIESHTITGHISRPARHNSTAGRKGAILSDLAKSPYSLVGKMRPDKLHNEGKRKRVASPREKEDENAEIAPGVDPHKTLLR